MLNFASPKLTQELNQLCVFQNKNRPNFSKTIGSRSYKTTTDKTEKKNEKKTPTVSKEAASVRNLVSVRHVRAYGHMEQFPLRLFSKVSIPPSCFSWQQLPAVWRRKVFFSNPRSAYTAPFTFHSRQVPLELITKTIFNCHHTCGSPSPGHSTFCVCLAQCHGADWLA